MKARDILWGDSFSLSGSVVHVLNTYMLVNGGWLVSVYEKKNYVIFFPILLSRRIPQLKVDIISCKTPR